MRKKSKFTATYSWERSGNSNTSVMGEKNTWKFLVKLLMSNKMTTRTATLCSNTAIVIWYICSIYCIFTIMILNNYGRAEFMFDFCFFYLCLLFVMWIKSKSLGKLFGLNNKYVEKNHLYILGLQILCKSFTLNLLLTNLYTWCQSIKATNVMFCALNLA